MLVKNRNLFRTNNSQISKLDIFDNQEHYPIWVWAEIFLNPIFSTSLKTE